ncbi:MAG: nuclear transport factor 2 family protein [Chloroflexota bacterium]
MSDHEGIRHTMAQFSHFLDGRQFRQWADLFTEDGRFNELAGREAIFDMISHAELASQPELRRKHTIENLVIDVHADEAEVASDLVMFDRIGDGPWTIRIGRYQDRMVRQAGRWLFAQRRLTWL